MVPDSTEGRLNRVERDVSALQQQVHDVVADLEKLDAARMAIIEMKGDINRVDNSLRDVRRAIQEETIANRKAQANLQDTIDIMKKDQQDQARANKTQMWSAAVAIITTLLVVGGGILGALIGG